MAGFEVKHLGGLAVKCPLSVRAKIWYYRNFAKQGFDHQRNRTYLAKAAQATARRIQEAGPFDFLLAPSSYPLTGLKLNIPKFVWLDSTFAGLVDYYPEFRGLAQETLLDGVAIESQTLRECKGVLFSSEWAAEGAIRSYGLQERRVQIIPFGANMAAPYRDAAEVRQAIDQRSGPPYEFLFLGVDWNRKGGAFAVEVVQALNSLGVPCCLTIVGCHPDLPKESLSFTRVVGFLNKTQPGQLAQLQRLLAQSHFMILPTRAEAYGLVFAEAASFGVPSLAIATGGVPTLVQSERTGLLFPPEATPGEWAEKIDGLLKQPVDYSQMAMAAYQRYADTLNWTVAAKRLREVIEANLD